MGEHGSNYSGMLTSGSRGAMLRRRRRIAQGIHGTPLEVGRILVGAGHDLWLARDEPVHLVDD